LFFVRIFQFYPSYFFALAAARKKLAGGCIHC